MMESTTDDDIAALRAEIEDLADRIVNQTKAHDARVSELLEANSREVERRRAAERVARDLATPVDDVARTKILVLYFEDDASRNELVAAIIAEKPGMLSMSVPL